ALLGPAGLGRQSIQGSKIGNTLSGIPGVPIGASLLFNREPTQFTGANLLTILQGIRATQSAILENTDRSVRGIEVTKLGTLNPSNVSSSSAQHVNARFQRQIAADFVLSADFAYRHFIHL